VIIVDVFDKRQDVVSVLDCFLPNHFLFISYQTFRRHRLDLDGHTSLGVDRVAQTVQLLATGWTVRGSNPGGGEIFRTCRDRPWDPRSLLYNGYLFFPGGTKRPGRDTGPSLPFSAEVYKTE
jgi:hypothetical protein